MAGGWYRESFRHRMAAQGIKTSRYMSRKFFAEKQATLVPPKPQPASVKSIEKSVGISQMADSNAGRRVERSLGIGSMEDSNAGRRVERSLGIGQMDDAKRAAPTRTGPVKSKAEVDAERKGLGVPEVSSRASKWFDALQSSIGFKQVLERYAREEGTQVGRAIKQASEGNYVNAMMLYNQLAKDPTRAQDAEVLRASLEAYAIQAAERDVSIPDAVYSMLSSASRLKVDAIRKQHERELESPFKTEMRQIGREAAIGLLEAPGEGVKAEAEWLGEAYNAELKPFPGAPGSRTDFPGIMDPKVGGEVPKLPFVTENVVLNEPRTTTGQKIDKAVGGLKTVFDSAGFTTKRSDKTYSERVQDRVDALFQGRSLLADVDDSAFDRGSRAFEDGDREGLIDAIVDLKSQEATLRDRWALVEAAHAQVVSAQNNDSIYGDTGGGVLSNVMGGGAHRIHDQTKKLNTVKAEVKKANDRLFARRRILEYRLKRVDQAVPPESGAPATIKVFSERGFLPDIGNFARSAEVTLKGAKNPVFNDMSRDES